MAKAYNQSFKEKILEDIKQSNLSVRQAAKKYKISPNTVYNWVNNQDNQDPQYLRDLQKKYKNAKAQNKILVELVKKFALEAKGSKKINNRRD